MGVACRVCLGKYDCGGCYRAVVAGHCHRSGGLAAWRNPFGPVSPARPQPGGKPNVAANGASIAACGTLNSRFLLPLLFSSSILRFAPFTRFRLLYVGHGLSEGGKVKAKPKHAELVEKAV